MTTSTEPTVYTSRNDHRWMKSSYTPPEQTVPLTTGSIAQGSFPLGQPKKRVLMGQGLSFASLVADLTNPPGNWTLLWRLEDIEILPISSVPFPHLAFADDGEIKFVEDQEGIHFYPGFRGAGVYDYSTDPTARMPKNHHRRVLGSYMPPEQPEFFTTEPMVKDQSPSFASLVADLTSPPGLLGRLEALECRSESERWPAAEWPSNRAFADARAFIHALSSIPLPHLSFADDGEINFLWDQDGIHIDLGFYGTGTYSYFARGKDEEGFYADDVPASDGLPDALVALLGS